MAELPVVLRMGLERFATQPKHRDGKVGPLIDCSLVPSEQVVDHVDIRANQTDDPFVGSDVSSVVDCYGCVFDELNLPLEGFFESYLKTRVFCCCSLFIAIVVIL